MNEQDGQPLRTLYQWSRVNGRINSHAARWQPKVRLWREELPNGWMLVEDGVWQETPEAARAQAREHFLRERARANDALAYLEALTDER